MLLAWLSLRVEISGRTNPTPREPLGESATEKRAHDCGDGIHGSDHTEILRALGRRCGKADNAEQADSHTRTANTLNSSTDNQRCWVLCQGADDAANLEDQNADRVPQLDGQVFEELSPCGLEAAKGHEVRSAVPRNIVKVLELVGDFGDGGTEDGLVHRCWSVSEDMPWR
jgi:hypothetical protein